ncbi:hypothetical protein NL317_28340, partial [Klebsiella pneumoniae]|nr:hypothetical protein [Klebsiella pneumoniae]
TLKLTEKINAPIQPSANNHLVLAYATNTVPVVLKADCIIAAGASHTNKSPTKNHFWSKNIFVKSVDTATNPSIIGALIDNITFSDFK